MYLNRCPRFGLLVAILAAVFSTISGSADAHVKWFCGTIDLRAAPSGLSTVLSLMFLTRAIGFLALVTCGSALDAYIAKRWPRVMAANKRSEVVEEFLIRLGVAGYALSLWDRMAVVPWSKSGDGAILTPELFEHDRLVGLLQLVVALTLVSRRTSPLAGLGLVSLFFIGVFRYGFFHMTDYAFFLGIAGYLLLSAPQLDGRIKLRSWRVSLLAATLSFSLMWTAIEKFLYPAWTDIVLVAHPDITLGFPAPFVTLTAGFVEFSLAFYLLVGGSLLRPGALLFMLIFIAAIPEFGTLDAAGHLPIIAIFLVIIIHGPTRLQSSMRSHAGTIVKSTMQIAGLYFGGLVAMMAAYYGLQQTTWW